MKWTTKKVKISELKGWSKNPRQIKKDEYEKLVGSINELGNFEPLVINSDNTVIAGNQRLGVLQSQGIDEVEVSVPERELTQKEIDKIGLLSNRHSGEWDLDILANEFDEDLLGEVGLLKLLPNESDIDFDNIESNENREKKFKEIDVVCPHCNKEFKFEV